MTAKGFHVWEYIYEEMVARCWTHEELAERMGGNVSVNLLKLDILQHMRDPRLVVGQRTADKLALAFGNNAETWLRLDAAWRRHGEHQGSTG